MSYNTKALLLQLKYKILHKNIIVPLLGIFSTAVQAMVIGLVKKKKRERETNTADIFNIHNQIRLVPEIIIPSNFKW